MVLFNSCLMMLVRRWGWLQAHTHPPRHMETRKTVAGNVWHHAKKGLGQRFDIPGTVHSAVINGPFPCVAEDCRCT